MRYGQIAVECRIGVSRFEELLVVAQGIVEQISTQAFRTGQFDKPIGQMDTEVIDHRTGLLVMHLRLGKSLCRPMASNNLAALEGSQGNWQQASAGYEQAAAEISQLVRRHPLLPRYRRELAITQSNRGLALAWLGEHEASDAAFAFAAETLKSLVADFPTQSIYQHSLAALANNRGVALRATGRPDEALAAFADAVEQQEAIAASGVAGPTHFVMLDKQYRNYADALREANQDEAAQRLELKRSQLPNHSPAETITPTKHTK